MKSCFILTAACLLFIDMLQAADTEAPFFATYNVTPAAVDITTGDVTVQVTVQVTDNDSGFNEGNVYLNNAAGQHLASFYFNSDDVQLGGDDKDGTYIVDVVIPQYGAGGNWKLDGWLVDKDGQRRFYGSGGGKTPVPGSNHTVAVTNTGDVDTVKPVIESLSISPSTVDVSTQSQTVTVTTRITDNLSGLYYGRSILLDGSSSETGINHNYNPDDAVGTAIDGTYTYNLTIPRGTKAGTYQLGHELTDRIDNTAYLYDRPDSYITVVNSSIPEGQDGEVSDACDATQFDWSTYGNEPWFYQTATTHDGIDAARSGPIEYSGQSIMTVAVTGPGTLKFWWKTDCASGDSLSVYANGLGNALGISGGSPWIPVSLDIEEGEQTITWTYSKNGTGSAGEDCGWVDRVQFIAEEDTEAPVVQYLSISPNPASIANGDVDVTLTFEVSDDYSGVAGGEVIIWDPSGSGFSTSFDSNDRVEEGGDDDSFGTYQVTFTMPQSEFYADPPDLELGVWQAQITVEDNDFNTRIYGQGNEDFPIVGTGEFTVTGDPVGGTLDIASIDSFVPNPVDVSAGTQTLIVNFTLDDPEGVFGYGNLFLYRTDGKFVDNYFFDWNDGSGEQYSVTVEIPQYGQPDEWRVGFQLTDMNDHETNVSGWIQNPDDDKFTVINTSGEVDNEPAVVSSIAISPKVISTSAGPANIAVTVGISDALSGLGSLFLYFTDPSGAESYQYVDGATITSGSFTVNRTLPQGSEEGVWHCSLVTRDKAGNYLRYGPRTGETGFPTATDAEFTVGPVAGSSFFNFAAGYSLAGNDALLGANPDNDWAPNAMEFLLGLDPTVFSVPDSALYQVSRIGNELRLDFKPAVELTITNNGDFLNVANSAGDAPVHVTGQMATDLAGPWTNILPVSVGDGIYRVALPVGPNARGFCRLMFLDP